MIGNFLRMYFKSFNFRVVQPLTKSADLRRKACLVFLEICIASKLGVMRLFALQLRTGP